MSSADPTSSISFEPIPGWTSYGPSDSLLADPQFVPTAWSMTVALDPKDQAFVDDAGSLNAATFPVSTIETLASGEIVIVASLPLADLTLADGSAMFPALKLPLKLSDADPGLTWDNVPELPNLQRFVVNAAVGGMCVQAHVYIGLPDMTGGSLQMADAGLAALQVPLPQVLSEVARSNAPSVNL